MRHETSNFDTNFPFSQIHYYKAKALQKFVKFLFLKMI